MNTLASSPIAKYAERKERNPRVAIFDGFAEGKEAPQHGDKVEDIIRRTSGLTDAKIQNYQNAYEMTTTEEDILAAAPEDLFATVKAYTEESVTAFFAATGQNIETVLSDEKTKVRVINQSQSTNSVRVSRPFVKQILEDDGFRQNVRDALGLPLRSHKSTVAEAFLTQVQGIFEGSEAIAESEKNYLATEKKAHDKGIAHVVTSGNLGRLATQYEELGIQAPAGAYKSVLATEYATIIGATEGRGTTTTRDDRAADFTSRYAGAEFAMQGVNVGVVGDKDFANGTSFSAPQATALIYEIFEENPKLSVPEMEDILYKSSIPVKGTKDQVGAGQIDPERARFLAEQSAFVEIGSQAWAII